jgi:transketolase
MISKYILAITVLSAGAIAHAEDDSIYGNLNAQRKAEIEAINAKYREQAKAMRAERFDNRMDKINDRRAEKGLEPLSEEQARARAKKHWQENKHEYRDAYKEKRQDWHENRRENWQEHKQEWKEKHQDRRQDWKENHKERYQDHKEKRKDHYQNRAEGEGKPYVLKARRKAAEDASNGRSGAYRLTDRNKDRAKSAVKQHRDMPKHHGRRLITAE